MVRSHHAIRNRPARRAVAMVAAVGIALAQLLAIWHVATVKHHWCAEHDELCEDRSGHDGSSEPSAGSDASPSIRSSAPSAPGDLHAEGCSLHGICLASTLQEAPRSDTVLSIQLVAVESLPQAEPHVSLRLLRLAPKTSPPSA